VSRRARCWLALAALTGALVLAVGGPGAMAPAAPPPASAAECAAWGSRVERLSARIRAAVAVSRRARAPSARAAALTVARRLARGRAGYRGLIAAGCTPGPPQEASGLAGTVVISPSTPVCVVGRPCSAPATGVTLVFEQAGQVVATATTGTGGEYRVALPPGTYTVRAPGASIGGGIEVVGGAGDQVTVPAGRYGRVDLTLDVGIR
jgi:hypothetical protein